MTAQAPEVLVNEYSEIDFGNLEIYGVETGDITEVRIDQEYVFKTKPDPDPGDFVVISTALKRGYVGHFRLKANGELFLEYYEFPQYENVKPQIVNEKLEGDFWLRMREYFDFGDTVYVPFRSGKVVSDKNEWVIH